MRDRTRDFVVDITCLAFPENGIYCHLQLYLLSYLTVLLATKDISSGIQFLNSFLTDQTWLLRWLQASFALSHIWLLLKSSYNL